MKNITLQKWFVFSLSIFIFTLFGTEGLLSIPLCQEEKPKHQIKKAKIYREDYPLISESDLYCSFFIIEDKKFEVEIIGAEKEEEKMILTESDIVFINKGKDADLELDQVFLILEVGEKILNPVTNKKLGFLGLKRGRVRILDLGENWAKAEIEKACAQIMIGNFLIPFEEKKDLLEKAPSIDISQRAGEVLTGNIVYLDLDFQIGAKGHLALIDLGREDGLQVGERMNIFRFLSEKVSPEAIGDLIVVDTQRTTSTVKILSSTDVVRIGDVVQTLTEEMYEERIIK